MKIALCGKMRSGKDVFASILEEEYGFTNFKFSKGVSEIIEKYLSNDGSTGKVREFYQHIGQGMRMIDEDVWVNYTLNDILKHFKNYGMSSDVVISDLRQMNEYEALRDEGFIIVKIISDEDKRIERALASNDSFDLGALSHETELSVDDMPYDYLIENNGTLEEFKKSIDLLMLEIIADELSRAESKKERKDS